MRSASILQFGAGNVGRELIAQIAESDYPLRYVGIASKDGQVEDPGGIAKSRLLGIAGGSKEQFAQKEDNVELVRKAADAENLIVVDVTASGEMHPALAESLRQGASIVLANKKPFCTEYAKFRELFGLAEKHGGQVRFECTVGSALPIIETVRGMQACGNRIMGIQGCFSGTLGFVCTSLDEGKKFSEIVREAKKRGYTEPDPRDDLSGTDVARKALILARLCGRELELSDVEIESLVPKELENVPVAEFLERIGMVDAEMESRCSKAKENGCALRYVAQITEDSVRVGMKEAEKGSQIGSLKGTDNIISIRSRWYDENPLVIIGRGAGVHATASGVFNDILQAAGPTPKA